MPTGDMTSLMQKLAEVKNEDWGVVAFAMDSNASLQNLPLSRIF